MSPSASLAHLRSPGRAISKRTQVEYDVGSKARKSYRKFLINVERSANSHYAITASIHNPFTLGGVLGHWNDVVNSILSAIADLFVVPSPIVIPGQIAQLLGTDSADLFLKGVQGRLLNAGLPGEIYTSVTDTLKMAATFAWSKSATADALATIMDDSSASIDRIVRTESTAAYNFGVLSDLTTVGATTKMWVAVGDGATRATHAEADGQVVPLAEPFIVGGYAMDAPGDFSGPPEEVYNCRCVVIEGTATEATPSVEDTGP